MRGSGPPWLAPAVERHLHDEGLRYTRAEAAEPGDEQSGIARLEFFVEHGEEAAGPGTDHAGGTGPTQVARQPRIRGNRPVADPPAGVAVLVDVRSGSPIGPTLGHTRRPEIGRLDGVRVG